MLALDRIVPVTIVEGLFDDGVEVEIIHGPTCGCPHCIGFCEYSLEHCQEIIRQGGGIIPLGPSSGLLVGGRPLAIPFGWAFVDIKGLRATELKALVDRYRRC